MNQNNGVFKGLLLALLAIYVISPVDLAPGPIDDLLLVLFTMASNMRRNDRGKELPEDTLEGEWRE